MRRHLVRLMRFWDDAEPADVGCRYGTAGERASYTVFSSLRCQVLINNLWVV